MSKTGRRIIHKSFQLMDFYYSGNSIRKTEDSQHSINTSWKIIRLGKRIQLIFETRFHLLMDFRDL